MALAAMNGIAALLSCGRSSSRRRTSSSAAGLHDSVHQRAACGRLSRSCYMVLASMAAGAQHGHDAEDAEAFREFVNASTGPVIYSVGTTRRADHAVHLPVVVRAAGGRLDDLEPDAAVPRPVDARSRTSTRSSPSRTTCRSWRSCSCWRFSPGWRPTGR